jgi:hypothetical protein
MMSFDVRFFRLIAANLVAWILRPVLWSHGYVGAGLRARSQSAVIRQDAGTNDHN